jgi:hypothetical protein
MENLHSFALYENQKAAIEALLKIFSLMPEPCHGALKTQASARA